MAELPFIENLRKLGHIGLPDALAGLLDTYPAQERPKMEARLALGGPNCDMAALLELAAHRLLVRSGFTVDAVEPDLTALGLRGRPDFLATHPTCGQAIVEVRNASTADEKAKFEDKTVNEVLAGLNEQLQPGEWCFTLAVIARQGSGIPFSKLADAVRKQMTYFSRRGINPEPFRIDDPAISFQLTPHPREPGGRVAVWSGGWAHETWQTLPIVDRLRKVLGQKGSKYGTPSQPLVLIVGLDGYMSTGADEIMSALLGRPTWNSAKQADGSDAEWWGRDNSGLFGTPSSPQFTRISGILFVSEWNMTGLAGQFIQPRWTMQKPWAWFVTNPYARWPVPDIFDDLPGAKFVFEAGKGIMVYSHVGRDLVDFLFS